MFVLPAWQQWFDARLILEPEMATWFLVAGSNRIPRILSHSSIKTKALPNTRSEVSAKLKLAQLSTLRRRHSSLIWPFAKWKLWREWLSHSGHCLTLACVLSVRDWWLLWTGLLHECPFNGQDWQDFERGQIFVLPAWQKLFDARLILEPEKATWFLVAGSCHTAASATKALPNTRSEVSSKLKLSQLSRLRRRHSSLIWPFAQMKTVERMDLSQWSLLDTCMCSLFGTGDYCGLDCCTNAHSIGRTGKTLNESKCSFFQHGKSCLMLGSFSNRQRQCDSW